MEYLIQTLSRQGARDHTNIEGGRMVKQFQLNYRDVVDRYPDLTPAETGIRFRNEFPGAMLHAYFGTGGVITGFMAIFATEEAEILFRLKW